VLVIVDLSENGIIPKSALIEQAGDLGLFGNSNHSASLTTWYDAIVVLGTASSRESLEKQLGRECNAIVFESHKLSSTLAATEDYCIGTTTDNYY
jgi:hypothetical protein